MTPLIPYVELPDITLLPPGTFGPGSAAVSLKPFGLLVAFGVYVGAGLAARYGRRRGLSPPALTSFILWVVGLGFVFGHVLDVVFYAPARVLDDPWVLVRFYDGLSSYGGFIGGALGAVWFKLRHRMNVMPYADVVASALPVGWVFGRAGCAVVHDHAGIASDAWFAVAYPDGGRIDLGLAEMLLTIPIALAFLALRRRTRPWGFFVALLALAYAPLRFALDFLRLDKAESVAGRWVEPDARYLSLTPAQWASLGLAGFGAALAFRVFARTPGAASSAAPPVPRAFAGSERSDTDAERAGDDPRAQR